MLAMAELDLSLTMALKSLVYVWYHGEHLRITATRCDYDIHTVIPNIGLYSLIHRVQLIS
jgi:hypothetical protein